ncbi:muskelin isoform X2 [Danaus plexippus]|uniref:Muskelin n=1 Tax=Danaus plexippus plexippus TaxID=278856 RepID=A0A212ELF0_DANPL|nr:muskelin isoform X2 [Danaus plexippus]OWR42316.1 muskelin [Danaus plexippus plexippus]
MDNKCETVKLSYTVHRYSSYSANYLPENILINKPSDQLSRWFTDSSTPCQYILLKLENPAIVESITFGKYIKAHVSDLKKFQILGGTDENNLSLLLKAGLKKDNSTETFTLRHRTSEGLFFPVQYIKIVPLQSWGPAYNYTIWYVELNGKNQEDFVNNALETISLRKEEEAVRILLKHLRRRRYKDAFEALTRESGVQLEGPMQGRLWNALVENGDYELAEQIFEEAANSGELDWYLSWQPYTPEWKQLVPCSSVVEERLYSGDTSPPPHARAQDLSCADRQPQIDPLEANGVEAGGVDGAVGGAGCVRGPGGDGESAGGGEAAASPCLLRPVPRGGHQLVVDPNTGLLYLFGGWNGEEDLDDLWSFDPSTESWRLLCLHSGAVGGPSPRSCHKMVFDPVHEKLYTLGRYLDNVQRVPENMKCELYSYSVREGVWRVSCEDTAAAGGPRLVFDHQMCLDASEQTIYVFGGRVLPANTEELSSPQYSGLFSYHIESNVWRSLEPEPPHPAPPHRVSHSMLFHPVQRRLYMFAGQRNKEQLVDMWWWDCEEAPPRPHALCTAPPRAPPPQGFTQRATIDPHTDEIHVLSGMSKEKDKCVYNTLWVFSLRRMTWSCLYRNDSVEPSEPRPRFAHQFVYDPVRKVHYLFGGNPGLTSSPRLRLDDLWSLRLHRAGCGGVRAKARAALREARYRELAAAPERAPAALHYLRHALSEAIDHSSSLQVAHFQKLATVLFSGRTSPDEDELLYGSEAAGAGTGRPLDVGRVRTLRRRRAAARRDAYHADLPRALLSVLGTDEPLVEPSPFEDECPSPEPAEEPRDSRSNETWETRAARIRLYDRLCRYFRPSAVPPADDIQNLVHL